MELPKDADCRGQPHPVAYNMPSKHLQLRTYYPAPIKQQRQHKAVLLDFCKFASAFLIALACLDLYQNGDFGPSLRWSTCFRSQPTTITTIIQSSSDSVPPLEVFQVTRPAADVHQRLFTDNIIASEECKLLLMNHSFGYSYGKPFIGTSISESDESTIPF